MADTLHVRACERTGARAKHARRHSFERQVRCYPRNHRRHGRGELNRRGVRLCGESDGIKTTMAEPYVPTLAGDGGLTAE